MKIIRLSAILSIIALVGCASNSPRVEQDTKDPKLITHAEASDQELISAHPVKYIELASSLFKKGNLDESVVWYYVGQMRFRAHLEANPDLEKSGDPALYASLKYVVGTPLNEYAGGDPENWVKLIEQAMNWNKNNPNLFTPKDRYPEIYSELEANFIEFRDYILNNKDEIRKQRKENGLENR